MMNGSKLIDFKHHPHERQQHQLHHLCRITVCSNFDDIADRTLDQGSTAMC
jgi:hypothetical protein